MVWVNLFIYEKGSKTQSRKISARNIQMVAEECHLNNFRQKFKFGLELVPFKPRQNYYSFDYGEDPKMNQDIREIVFKY